MTDATIILIAQILMGMVANYIVGCGVLAAVDQDDKLREWVFKCPLPFGAFFLIQAWPVVAVCFRKGWW